jgi:hypothetical protein
MRKSNYLVWNEQKKKRKKKKKARVVVAESSGLLSRFGETRKGGSWVSRMECCSSVTQEQKKQ